MSNFSFIFLQPPEEPESWTCIRDATEPGNKCCQLNPYSNTSIDGSEDCLYLNVYTPSLPQDKIEKLPVIFFVHGGRFIFGFGDYYKPDYLIKHDVILVTINYRLHILGFLCLNIPEVPGNAALKDSIMALRWVNKNIVHFNGDPNNITAMGESAGAALVASYQTSKMADGLFHKLICQSGVSMSDVFMIEEQDPIEKAKVVASNLGKELTDERSLYEFLVDVPVEDLVIAFSTAEISRPPSVINAFFLPVVEKEFENVERFFDENPRRDMILNRFKDVPSLFGLNSHEGAFFIQRDGEGSVIFEKDFFYFIPRYTHVQRTHKRATEISKKLREFYFGSKELNDACKAEYVDLLSDRFFNYDAMQAVEILSKSPSNIYFYKFEYNGNLNTRMMKSLGMQGASHGDMIQYQFYRRRKHEKATKKDLVIVEMLSEAWCNFAKTG